MNLKTLSARGLALIAMILCAACVPGDASAPWPAMPTPTYPPGLAGPREGGAAVLVFDYSLRSEDGIFATEVHERLPIYFFVDASEPRASTILAGGQSGVELLRIQGLDGGLPCWLELTYTVRFDITGSFDPTDGCRLLLQVITVPDPAQIALGGSCPPEAGATFPPEVLFVSPYSGPFEFTAPYAPIDLSPAPGVSVHASLEAIALPPATGCP